MYAIRSYYEFYWDQVLLETNNPGQRYHTILAGSSNAKTSPRHIRLYVPIPPEKKPKDSQSVLKYSEQVLTTLEVHATKGMK